MTELGEAAAFGAMRFYAHTGDRFDAGYVAIGQAIAAPSALSVAAERHIHPAASA